MLPRFVSPWGTEEIEDVMHSYHPSESVQPTSSPQMSCRKLDAPLCARGPTSCSKWTLCVSMKRVRNEFSIPIVLKCSSSVQLLLDVIVIVWGRFVARGSDSPVMVRTCQKRCYIFSVWKMHDTSYKKSQEKTWGISWTKICQAILFSYPASFVEINLIGGEREDIIVQPNHELRVPRRHTEELHLGESLAVVERARRSWHLQFIRVVHLQRAHQIWWRGCFNFRADFFLIWDPAESLHSEHILRANLLTWMEMIFGGIGVSLSCKFEGTYPRSGEVPFNVISIFVRFCKRNNTYVLFRAALVSSLRLCPIWKDFPKPVCWWSRSRPSRWRCWLKNP